jgi:Ser/Thr protein kinase RdoA (MazF antagonist)
VTEASSAPYAGLSPDVVLDALDAVGLRGDGRLLQLNSYENRVYQVWLEDGRAVVAKFYRAGRWSDAQILEEHAFAAALAADEIPVAAPLELAPDGRAAQAIGATLARSVNGTLRYAVAERVAGRAPELDDLDVLERIGSYLGRIHRIGAQQPFETRLTLDVATLGTASRDWLLAHDAIPAEAVDGWRAAAAEALALAQAAFDARADTPRLRLHGDCHPGNILWSDAGPCFVDLDDAMNGPAVQDLWMLFGADTAGAALAREAVLEGYERFRAFDRRELTLVEPLRTLRMVHHSAWIARRWHDPAFPAAFPFFTAADYWRQQAMQLREQAEAMREAG